MNPVMFASRQVDVAANGPADNAPAQWLTVFGDADPEHPIDLVHDLLHDGADPVGAEARRLLLEIEFPELGCGMHRV